MNKEDNLAVARPNLTFSQIIEMYLNDEESGK